MSERISKAMLEGMFARAVAQAATVGIDTTGWALEHGNRAAGITYKLSNNNGSSAPIDLGGWDGQFLGWTKAEAYASLRLLWAAWDAVEQAGRKAPTALVAFPPPNCAARCDGAPRAGAGRCGAHPAVAEQPHL